MGSFFHRRGRSTVRAPSRWLIHRSSPAAAIAPPSRDATVGRVADDVGGCRDGPVLPPPSAYSRAWRRRDGAAGARAATPLALGEWRAAVLAPSGSHRADARLPARAATSARGYAESTLHRGRRVRRGGRAAGHARRRARVARRARARRHRRRGARCARAAGGLPCVRRRGGARRAESRATRRTANAALRSGLATPRAATMSGCDRIISAPFCSADRTRLAACESRLTSSS